MVQIHLGHKSLRTTERYTHVTQEEVAEEVRKRINEFFHKTNAGPKIANPLMHQVGLPGFEPGSQAPKARRIPSYPTAPVQTDDIIKYVLE